MASTWAQRPGLLLGLGPSVRFEDGFWFVKYLMTYEIPTVGLLEAESLCQDHHLQRAGHTVHLGHEEPGLGFGSLDTEPLCACRVESCL